MADGGCCDKLPFAPHRKRTHRGAGAIYVAVVKALPPPTPAFPVVPNGRFKTDELCTIRHERLVRPVECGGERVECRWWLPSTGVVACIRQGEIHPVLAPTLGRFFFFFSVVTYDTSMCRTIFFNIISAMLFAILLFSLSRRALPTSIASHRREFVNSLETPARSKHVKNTSGVLRSIYPGFSGAAASQGGL